MAYIQQVNQDEACGTLKRIYDEARVRAGGVANIIKVQSLDPLSNQRSIQFYVSLMKSHNSLRAEVREMLAVVVSNANGCFY